MAISDRLARQLAALPARPGVYLWKDAEGEIVYVGKAANLRTRLPSYFAEEQGSTEREFLREQIADLETIIVPNEAQALLLENTLIKEHQPKFNIRLRDDKSYPQIAVTLAEPFPRVLVVRRVTIPGARYFGPYTDVATLRQTLKIVRRIFTVRSCSWHLPEEAPNRPCLDFHIDRCKAPCVAYQSVEDYRRMIDDVLLFLSGKTLDVRARLRERMQEASNAQDYERAAQLRDALKWLDQLEQPQTVEVVGGGDADAISLARDGDDAVGVILRIRDGKLVAREQRFLEHVEHAPEGEVLRTFLVGYYLPLEQRAQRVVLPFAPADLEALRELVPGVDFVVPQRGSAAKLVELADQNARHLLDSFKIETFDIDERAADPVFALGRDLGLPVVPRAMVCIDISTNQGRDTVGSLVWFEGGRPRKAEYRRYRIKGVEGIDDFAAMKEVVTRFLTRRIAENIQIPDLIVIDGGKGQLAAAVEAAHAQGQERLPIVSLAKREEEVFLPGSGEPLRLSRRSPSLKLLQRARDEAHRFAVTYSRKRRAQRTITSELLRIPGIGPARRRLLLERFGSLAGVRTATPTEIAALPGFSTKLADRILDRLNPPPPPPGFPPTPPHPTPAGWVPPPPARDHLDVGVFGVRSRSHLRCRRLPRGVRGLRIAVPGALPRAPASRGKESIGRGTATLDHVALRRLAAPARRRAPGHTRRGRDAAAQSGASRRAPRVRPTLGQGRKHEPHGIVQGPRTGRRVHAPATTPRPILDQIRAFGADLILLDGHIGDCGIAARLHADTTGAIDVSTLREPYRIEGKKTLGLELAEQLGWTLPDAIVYPTGGGTGLIGMWKAFQELRDSGWVHGPLPRMYTVQASGCAPVVQAFESGADRCEPWPDPKTVAAGLRVPSPLGDRLMLRALRDSGGGAVAVSDEALAAAAHELQVAEGIDASPEGGAALSGAVALKNRGVLRPEQRVVLFNTGAGWLYRA